MGMVYKDVLVLRKQIGYYGIFLVMYTVLEITGVFGASILPAMMVVISMMLPMSSFSYDDQARWDKFAVSTPAGRRGVILGKYLFTVLTILLSAVLILALQAALALMGLVELELMETCLIILICAGLSLVLNAVILPLMVRFGAEKSRIISMIMFVLIFGGAIGLGGLMKNSGPLPQPPAWLMNALPVVLGLVAVGGLVVSYFIARGIFEKKEL